MKRFSRRLLSRGRAHPGECFSVSRAQQHWLNSVLNGVFRQSVNLPKTDDTAESEFLAQLTDAKFKIEPLRLVTWLDEAVTPPDTRVLVLGVKVCFILGRRGSEVIFVAEGEGPPQAASLSSFVAEIKEARLYAVSVSNEDSPEKYGWRWFLGSFFSRRAVIRDAFVASLVIQLIALVFPLATQTILDKVITNQALSTLIAVGAGIVLFAVFNSVMSWLRQKLLLRLANVVDAELSVRVIAHMFRLPLRYFESRTTGTLLTRVHGVERVREFASGAFLLLALDLPFMLIFLALMLTYSSTLSAIVIVFVALMLGLSFACGPHLRTLANKQFEAGAKVQSFLTERIAAHETVKSLQLEHTAVSRFSELNQKQLDASLALREFGSGYGTIMQLLEQLMNATVLCLGAYLAMTTSSLTIGMLVAFNMFAQRVSQPLLKLSGLWQELQQVRTSVAQLGDVMGSPTENYSTVPTSAGPVKGRLGLQGLGFRHSADRPPLYKDLSFTVEPGQMVLVTGASGSGKSTLAKVMLGLYPDYDGFVRLDGRDIRSLSVSELRRLFGVVPQDTVLFSGTIVDNVTGGSGEPFEQAVLACRMAGIHEAIENLPNGYQTEVGERGVGLSGGQRQRIGIARALLKRPPVLIFDEATSGLDAASAAHIAQTVNFLRGKATVLFIAHKVPEGLIVDKHVKL